jgi:hypothetical protein
MLYIKKTVGQLFDELFIILTQPAFFPIEHRTTESLCYYAIKSQFDVLHLDM